MRIAILAVLLLFGASHPASAAERELAWRLGIARASVDSEAPGLIFGPGELDVEFRGFGPRFAVEAELNERYRLEFGWMQFGSQRYGVYEVDHGSAIWAAITPYLESGPWTLAAKLGATSATIDKRVSAPFESLSEKTISIEPLVGASATYHFNDRAGVQLSVEQVGDIATVIGLDYRHGWRGHDAAPERGLGFELLVGAATRATDIGSVRYSIGPLYDVVVHTVRAPPSNQAFGFRVPYASWLSFETVYFPTNSTTSFAIGDYILLLAQPTDTIGKARTSLEAMLTSSVETEGALLAARFEYEPAADLELFMSVGALAQRESVRLRDNETASLVFSEADTRVHPWLGAGLRYRLFKALAVTVEYAGSDGGGRARAMLGWTF